MPSLPSPEPTVSCFDDLDFFNDFENEFPAIVYNDAQTSKLDLLAEPILNPQHIDKFDLNDETSLSEYVEEEQNVLYFNDLFPFNIIHLNDLKSEKDNDNNEVDIIQSLGDMAPLPPRDQRHLWLRYQGLTLDMRPDLAERMRMVYTGDDGIGDEMGLDVAGTLYFQLGGARSSMTWRQFILAMGLHTAEEMAEDGFRAYWLGSERLIPDKGDISDYWVEISSGKDFLRGAPLYTYIRDPVRRLCHRLISYSISRRGQAPKKYLFRHAEGRKSGARLSKGHFIRRLAHHFGLVSDDGLRGLSVVARELPLIDMGELVATAGALGAAEDAPTVDDGVQADPAPIQAPQQPPPSAPAAGRTMPQRLGRLEEEVQGLRQDVRTLRGLVERSITDQGRYSTWMISCMTHLMKSSGQTFQAFDETFWGSSPTTF
ncbi:hypothetical protein Tco_0140776 [Tanacetum coccineum]